MLKRIIQTLNVYCYELSNQDLSKSLFLCLKILKKVIPKIAVPDTKQQGNKNEQSDAAKKNASASTKTVTINEAAQTLGKQNDHLDKDEEKTVESIASEVLNEIISLLEAKESPSDVASMPLTSSEICSPLKKNSKLIAKDDETKNNDVTIENCIYHLKELTHTFVKCHLFKNECDETDNSDNDSEEKINKSFSSLFYSNQLKSLFNLNDDGYLIDDYEEYFKIKNTTKNSQDQSETNNFLHNLILNEKNSRNNSSDANLNRGNSCSVYTIQLKHDCLNYLQSFQILNKLLIKMFFFPREQKRIQIRDESEDEDSYGKYILKIDLSNLDTLL